MIEASQIDPLLLGIGFDGRELPLAAVLVFTDMAGDEVRRYANAAASFAVLATTYRVCAENLIRVDDVMESPKLAE
jgi:hypothetical protein